MTLVRGDYRWLDSERGNPGPYGSNPIGAYTAVDRVSRGFDTHHQGSLQAQLPVGHAGWSGRMQQRLQVTHADLDNAFHSSFGDSFFERTARRRARRPISPRHHRPASRWASRDWPERARGTFFTGEQFAAGADRAPHDRRVRRGAAAVGHSRLDDGGRSRRLDSAGRARRRPLRLRASARVRRRHRDLGEPPGVGHGRRLAGLPRRGAHEAAGQRGHGHQAAGCLRDCVHRQSFARARA